MKKIFTHFIAALILMLSHQAAVAQSGEPCGTDQLMEELYRQHPELRKQADANFYRIRNGESGLASKTTANTVIPVVVHIVYNTNDSSAQIIPYNVVKNQMKILNNDFRRLNSDTMDTPAIFKPIAGATDFDFRLALVDPRGNPTDGVTYTPTTTVFGGAGEYRMKYDSTGGIDAWDVSRYLNIWVCNLSDQNLGGYAYLAEDSPFVGGLDGLVIKFSAFGGVGRTVTHEAGHYMGLRHTFDGGACAGDNASSCSIFGDRVCDTPPTSGINFSACAPDTFNTCTETPVDFPDQISNYMSYSSALCKDMFSKGQVTLMQGTMNSIRLSLALNPQNIVGPLDQKQNDAAIFDILSPKGTYCQGAAAVVFRMRNYGLDTIRNAVIRYSFDGTASKRFVYDGNLAPTDLTTLTLPGVVLANGSHQLNLSIDSVNGTVDQYPANSNRNLTFDVQTENIGTLSTLQSFECTEGPVPTNWTLTDGGNSNNWTLASVGGFGQTFRSIKREFYLNQGTSVGVERLSTPLLDLNSLKGDTSALLALTYNFAYVSGAASVSDELRIYLATDCGATETLLKTRKGNGGSNNLGTAPPSRYTQNTEFVPTASEWGKDVIDLTGYINQGFVKIIFETKSFKISTLYLDDILVASNKHTPKDPCAAPPPNNGTFTVAPNPVSGGSLGIVALQEITGFVEIQIFNLLGAEVGIFAFGGLKDQRTFTLALPQMESGIYYMRMVINGDPKGTQRLIITN